MSLMFQYLRIYTKIKLSFDYYIKTIIYFAIKYIIIIKIILFVFQNYVYLLD